jgi:hypothetical protein
MRILGLASLQFSAFPDWALGEKERAGRRRRIGSNSAVCRIGRMIRLQKGIQTGGFKGRRVAEFVSYVVDSVPIVFEGPANFQRVGFSMAGMVPQALPDRTCVKRNGD